MLVLFVPKNRMLSFLNVKSQLTFSFNSSKNAMHWFCVSFCSDLDNLISYGVNDTPCILWNMRTDSSWHFQPLY